MSSKSRSVHIIDSILERLWIDEISTDLDRYGLEVDYSRFLDDDTDEAYDDLGDRVMEMDIVQKITLIETYLDKVKREYENGNTK